MNHTGFQTPTAVAEHLVGSWSIFHFPWKQTYFIHINILQGFTSVLHCCIEPKN